MNKKRIIERARDRAVLRFRHKMIRLKRIESDIRSLILEFVELTGVDIKDIQRYDPKTGKVQVDI